MTIRGEKVRIEDVFLLDSGTRAWFMQDGTLYIATGDDYYDVTLTPDEARKFAAWIEARTPRAWEK